MCLTILRISLVIVAGGALSTAGSEPGWPRKRSLVQRGHLKQVLSEGERCWLGAELRRPSAAPQHHPFGVYPSRPGGYLRPYPLGGQGRSPTGRRKPGASSPAESLGLRGPAEQPAAPWATTGAGPAGWSEPRGDNDTSLGDRGSKEPLGEAGTREHSATAATVATTFAAPEEPKPETRRKGRAKTRHRRQVAKGQAGAARGDPAVPPRHLQPRPKHPPVPGVRTSPLEDSTQRGGGDPSWEAESHGGLPVLYFPGRRGRLLLRPEVLAEIPREAFTVEAWVRPEGGQSNPAIIAGNARSWALRGLRGTAGFVFDWVRGRGQGEGGGRKGLPGRGWGGRAFIHQPCRTPDIMHNNDSNHESTGPNEY